MVVWEDGGFEYDSYGKFSSMSTVAGKYYAAHDPCDMADNYPLCGSWIWVNKCDSVYNILNNL